jgi:hypothetical protein
MQKQHKMNMKTSTKIFAFCFAVATAVACAAGESEILKEARTMQEGLMKDEHALDSVLQISINDLNNKITMYSQDTMFMKDSTNLAKFSSIQTSANTLTELRSKLTDWAAGQKEIPTPGEIKNGAENPFGKDAKDQDILAAIKKSKEEFEALKGEIEKVEY